MARVRTPALLAVVVALAAVGGNAGPAAASGRQQLRAAWSGGGRGRQLAAAAPAAFAAVSQPGNEQGAADGTRDDDDAATLISAIPAPLPLQSGASPADGAAVATAPLRNADGSTEDATARAHEAGAAQSTQQEVPSTVPAPAPADGTRRSRSLHLGRGAAWHDVRRRVLQASPSPTPSPSAAVSPSPSESPASTPSGTPSAPVTPSITPSASITPSVSPSASITPSVSPTTSATASVTASATASPSPTPSPFITPSGSPSASMTPSPTASTSATRSMTGSGTATAAATGSGTVTAAATGSSTRTGSNTASPTRTPPSTGSATFSPSTTASTTRSANASPSSTMSASPTPSQPAAAQVQFAFAVRVPGEWSRNASTSATSAAGLVLQAFRTNMCAVLIPTFSRAWGVAPTLFTCRNVRYLFRLLNTGSRRLAGDGGRQLQASAAATPAAGNDPCATMVDATGGQLTAVPAGCEVGGFATEVVVAVAPPSSTTTVSSTSPNGTMVLQQANATLATAVTLASALQAAPEVDQVLTTQTAAGVQTLLRGGASLVVTAVPALVVATPASPPNDQPDNRAAVIAGSVLGSLGFVVLVAAYALYRRKQRREAEAAAAAAHANRLKRVQSRSALPGRGAPGAVGSPARSPSGSARNLGSPHGGVPRTPSRGAMPPGDGGLRRPSGVSMRTMSTQHSDGGVTPRAGDLRTSSSRRAMQPPPIMATLDGGVPAGRAVMSPGGGGSGGPRPVLLTRTMSGRPGAATPSAAVLRQPSIRAGSSGPPVSRQGSLRGYSSAGPTRQPSMRIPAVSPPSGGGGDGAYYAADPRMVRATSASPSAALARSPSMRTGSGGAPPMLRQPSGRVAVVSRQPSMRPGGGDNPLSPAGAPSWADAYRSPSIVLPATAGSFVATPSTTRAAGHASLMRAPSYRVPVGAMGGSSGGGQPQRGLLTSPGGARGRPVPTGFDAAVSPTSARRTSGTAAFFGGGGGSPSRAGPGAYGGGVGGDDRFEMVSPMMRPAPAAGAYGGPTSARGGAVGMSRTMSGRVAVAVAPAGGGGVLRSPSMRAGVGGAVSPAMLRSPSMRVDGGGGGGALRSPSMRAGVPSGGGSGSGMASPRGVAPGGGGMPIRAMSTRLPVAGAPMLPGGGGGGGMGSPRGGGMTSPGAMGSPRGAMSPGGAAGMRSASFRPAPGGSSGGGGGGGAGSPRRYG